MRIWESFLPPVGVRRRGSGSLGDAAEDMAEGIRREAGIAADSVVSDEVLTQVLEFVAAMSRSRTNWERTTAALKPSFWRAPAASRSWLTLVLPADGGRTMKSAPPL
jgi:hypothetical protein